MKKDGEKAEERRRDAGVRERQERRGRSGRREGWKDKIKENKVRKKLKVPVKSVR